MGDIAQDMRVGSDESSQWTEVRASNGQASDGQPQIPNQENLGPMDDPIGTEVRAAHGHLQIPNPENLVSMFDPTVVRMGRKIAEGGQGCIYEAKLYLPFSFEPLPVVVKKFKPYEGVSQVYLPREISSSKDPFICKPLGFFIKDNSTLYMVMGKYYSDLRTHIDSCMKELRKETNGYNGPPFHPLESTKHLLKLALGVKGLHEIGISHRDLKASNILVTMYREKDKHNRFYIDIALTDFETSEGVVGTGFYRAPEVLQYLKTRVPLSKDQWMKADIYSFGMVCYEVLTGRIPFSGHRPYDHDLVLNGRRPELPEHVTEHMKDMIRRCWHANPSLRPSWSDILQFLVAEFDAWKSALEEHFDPMSSVLYVKEHVALPSLGSLVGSSIESLVVKLNEEYVMYIEFSASTPKDFAGYEYWVEEFIASAEQYVSKFHGELPANSEGSLLCKWSEYWERVKLLSLLVDQFSGCSHYLRRDLPKDVVDIDYDWDQSRLHKSRISSIQGTILSIVVSQLGSGWEGNPCKNMSLTARFLYYNELIKSKLWSKSIIEHESMWDLAITSGQFPGGLRELLFGLVILHTVLLHIYFYVLAVSTFEPIILCLQYGIHKIRPGCKMFMYRSTGYRTCRLQRAWINYSRGIKLPGLVLLLYILHAYFILTGDYSEVFLDWILMYLWLYRFSRFWTPTEVSYDHVYPAFGWFLDYNKVGDLYPSKPGHSKVFLLHVGVLLTYWTIMATFLYVFDFFPKDGILRFLKDSLNIR